MPHGIEQLSTEDPMVVTALLQRTTDW